MKKSEQARIALVNAFKSVTTRTIPTSGGLWEPVTGMIPHMRVMSSLRSMSSP